MAFRFWNTAAIVRDLSVEQVSEADAVKYAVATGLSWTLANYYSAWVGGYRGWILVYELITVLGVTTLGTYECFRANGGVEGKNFLRNFACVGWPIGFKLLLLGVVIGIAMYYGFPLWVGATFRDPAFVYMVISFFVSVFLAVAFYWRISVHLATLRTKTRSNLSMEPTLYERSSS